MMNLTSSSVFFIPDSLAMYSATVLLRTCAARETFMTETVQENVVIQFAAKFQVIFFFGFQARDDSTPGHCLAIPLK